MENNEAKKRYTRIKRLDIRTFTMVAVLIILWLVFTYFTSNHFSNLSRSFISFRNISNLLRQMAIVGIMGCSMVLIIVTGGIDLAAGSIVGFVGCIAASLQVFLNIDTAPVILICVVLSIVVYLLQGSLIAYAGLAPFIVTLGGQLAFKGVVLGITKGQTIAPLRESLLYFGQGYISPFSSIIIGIIFALLLLANEFSSRKSKQKHGTLSESLRTMLLRWIILTIGIILTILIMNAYRGMPVPVLIMFIVAILLTLVAERTVFGRSIYAIGGNLDAAKYAGIKVKKNLVLVYVIHGVMVAIAGLILAARLNARTVTVTNMSLELDAIAAAIIGGTSMSGGAGKVAGALLGALIMASIDNGMSMMNMDAFWQYIVKGIILVAAVWFDIYTRSRKK
jgi:D-xylose transport system permease protein